MNTIQQAHILLVDDNTDLLRLLEVAFLSSFLSNAGHGTSVK